MEGESGTLTHKNNGKGSGKSHKLMKVVPSNGQQEMILPYSSYRRESYFTSKQSKNACN